MVAYPYPYSRYTTGFEVETFHGSVSEIAEALYPAGFGGLHQDGSGPMEFNSPVFSLFSERMPKVDILIATAIDYRDADVMLNEDYNDWEDEYYYQTASTHHHLARADYTNCRQYFDLYKYLTTYLPIIQPFLAFKIRRNSNKIILEWTNEDERRRWANEPYIPPSEYDWKGYCNGRFYWAVTPNPPGSNKPFTLEVRMCETAPHICQAGLIYLIVAYHKGIIPPTIDYYEDVDVAFLKKFIIVVEALGGTVIPEWAKKIARSVIKAKRPLTVRALIKQGVVSPSEVREAFRPIIMSEWSREYLEYLDFWDDVEKIIYAPQVVYN